MAVRGRLNRSQSPQHVNTIAVAGVIGTDFFSSAAKTLNTGGTGSLLIKYVTMGGVIYLTTLSLG